jgi:ankyrin repeat protein
LVADIPASLEGYIPFDPTDWNDEWAIEYDPSLDTVEDLTEDDEWMDLRDGPFWRQPEQIVGSPLASAANQTDEKTFRQLLAHSYKADWLTWAMLARMGHVNLAKYLLENGSPVIRSRSRNLSGRRGPLHYAIKNQSTNMVEALLAAGVDVNELAVLHYGRTPLQAAVEVSNLEIINLLLGRAADVNGSVADYNGAIALQLAAMTGQLGVAKKLLQCGADTNARRAKSYGKTALEGAAKRGHLDMIQLLLDHEVEPPGFGQSQYLRAVKFAMKETHHTAEKLLKSHREWTDCDEEMLKQVRGLDEGYWNENEDGEEDGKADEDRNYNENVSGLDPFPGMEDANCIMDSSLMNQWREFGDPNYYKYLRWKDQIQKFGGEIYIENMGWADPVWEFGGENAFWR